MISLCDLWSLRSLEEQRRKGLQCADYWLPLFSFWKCFWKSLQSFRRVSKEEHCVVFTLIQSVSHDCMHDMKRKVKKRWWWRARDVWHDVPALNPSEEEWISKECKINQWTKEFECWESRVGRSGCNITSLIITRIINLKTQQEEAFSRRADNKCK